MEPRDQDWTEEGIEEEEEEEESGLRRLALSSSADRGARSRSPSPSPRAGSGPVPHSVRTRRPPTAPVVPAAAAGDAGAGGSGGGSFDFDRDLGAGEETVSSTRDQNMGSSSITAGGRAEEVAGAGAPDFSFPPLQPPQEAVDAEEVLARFLEATMGTAAFPRTENLKKELLVDRKVADVAGLERWLRRTEAVAELAWFTGLCSNHAAQVPPLELFECAFRALEAARSDELHRCSADARRLWIGLLPVPRFFLCPFSKKIMQEPAVITSGKTVDHCELEKWWKENKWICPVTDEVLTHNIFILDALIGLCIARWRVGNMISDLTEPTDPPAISPEEEAMFKEAATLLAHSTRSCKEDYEAILRLVADQDRCSFLHLLGHSPGTITKLACVLLPETCLEPNPELDDIILDILAKAASYSPNKEVFGDDRYVIPVLIARALLGPVPTRAKCARILGLLAENYYNKIKIGELGGFAPLMELLQVGDIDVKKTAAMVLASLCEAEENWSRFVREGVADAAISLMRNHRLVDEAHSILSQSEGFLLAMKEVIHKLQSFDSDEMCKKMLDRLCSMGPSPHRRRRTRPENFPVRAPEASSSSSSSRAVTTDSISKILSWLQRKAYDPRTYRCRDYR